MTGLFAWSFVLTNFILIANLTRSYDNVYLSSGIAIVGVYSLSLNKFIYLFKDVNVINNNLYVYVSL